MSAKILSKKERTFNVCSDCAHFHKLNVIDDRYPEIVEGTCDLHEGIFDNRWDTDCKDCTNNCICADCIYFAYEWIPELKDRIPWCQRWNNDVEPKDEVCIEFERINREK